MIEARFLDRLRALWALLALIGALLLAVPAVAQPARINDSNMRAELVASGPVREGREWLVALHFTPRTEEWHGYWKNPGDAGLGMTLDWDLPSGWSAGEPRYPVPHTLVIGGLMNHVYKGPYAVVIPIRIPAGGNVPTPVSVTADYLACTDTICVPQQARLTLDPARAVKDPRFDSWLAAIAPPLGSPASFEITGERLRIGIPLPASVERGAPHLFLAEDRLGDGLRPAYAEIQTFISQGDLLVAEVPLRRSPPVPGLAPSSRPTSVSGILSFGDGNGVSFAANPADVPLEGVAPLSRAAVPALGWLALAAVAGGLLLNIMPCVFPILSLKALALAKAGGDERAARRDALAYTAGVVLACAALGALLLLLRSAGEQVGWAFQLQQPGVVVALFLLALAITANFIGLFEVPGLAIAGGGASGRGSFATGLLAAFVATPCTGPFMAAALGAALLLPVSAAMLLFVLLGVGLALPFLVVGFVPAIRRMLPRPGPWMETFRRWMALPMGLTALALGWLLWRLGGGGYLLGVVAVAMLVVALLVLAGRTQRNGRGAGLMLGAAAAVAVLSASVLPRPVRPDHAAEKSLIDAQPFSDQALATARTSGKPVFVWFTADWCVSCKVNERIAIERESTRAAFDKAGVISLRGDWTLRDPQIARFLTEHGAAGVPLYLWYRPGGDAEILPQVLTPGLLAGLAQGQPASGPQPVPRQSPLPGNDRPAGPAAGLD